MENETKKTMTRSEAAIMLRVSLQTITNLVRDGKISVVSENTDPITEVLLSREDFQKQLKSRELPEKFLLAPEVAKLLNLRKTRIEMMCRENLIPCYRLNDTRGSRFLFIEDEILNSKIEVNLEPAADFYATRWRIETLNKLVDDLLWQAKHYGILSTMSFDIVRRLMTRKETLQKIADDYKLTKERIRQIFAGKFNGLIDGISHLYRDLQIEKEKNALLLQENVYLREQWPGN